MLDGGTPPPSVFSQTPIPPIVVQVLVFPAKSSHPSPLKSPTCPSSVIPSVSRLVRCQELAWSAGPSSRYRWALFVFGFGPSPADVVLLDDKQLEAAGVVEVSEPERVDAEQIGWLDPNARPRRGRRRRGLEEHPELAFGVVGEERPENVEPSVTIHSRTMHAVLSSATGSNGVGVVIEVKGYRVQVPAGPRRYQARPATTSSVPSASMSATQR